MGANPVEVVVGFLLIFFLPGYGLTRALFPEWRIRGEVALERLVETVTLSFVASVTLTIVVGFLLLNGQGPGFQASWSDPVLEALLGAIAVVTLGVALVRGAFARDAPAGPAIEPAPGSDGGWELLRSLEGLYRRERRLRHQLRTAPKGSPEADVLSGELDEVRAESERLRRAREAEYGS